MSDSRVRDGGPRRAGLLLHPTSLPGRYGIGDLGPTASAFLAWAADAGQAIWQVLPLGPTGMGDSPYGCLSAFAGNPLLISPERLAEEGLLPREALTLGEEPPGDRVAFEAARARREQILRASFAHFRAAPPAGIREAFEAFVDAPEQRSWLEDWTLFSALKAAHDGREWTAWDAALRDREPGALESAVRRLGDETSYHRYCQFLFFRQWAALRAEAHRRGISILGDVPIYLAFDSAEVWASRGHFELDDTGRPLRVAGVPPDYFSRTGQLWGNPLYRWERFAAEGFAWWIERLRANLRLADVVRLDHFRGFAAYWAVPAGDSTAVGGEWVEGPGHALFAALRQALGDLPLVAEDLGVITPDVESLRDAFGLPGMKVLQFGFSRGSGHSPHDVPRHAVVYTGTHDNDTARGWFENLRPAEQQRVLAYVGGSPESIGWGLLQAAYNSAAATAIAPLQDVLGLGSDARMNLPGRPDGNWSWRVRADQVSAAHRQQLARLVDVSERVAPDPAAYPVVRQADADASRAG